MLNNYINPDFLILTAMPIEFRHVKQLLDDVVQHDFYYFGTVSRKGTFLKYTIALYVTGQGPEDASMNATIAINELKPKRIILTGIAAGFKELDVNCGDIIIPNSILDYSYSKSTDDNKDTLINTHRRESRKLSKPMQKQAASIYQSIRNDWGNHITTKRPDGTESSPSIICDNFTILGCGPKVVGTELDDDRKWIINKEAYGLEMESYAVLNVCIDSDKPCLVIKGVQDNGSDKTDAWRMYSSEVAAIFTIQYIQNYKEEDINTNFENALIDIKNNVVFKSPEIPFDYNVKLCHMYNSHSNGIYEHEGPYNEVLIPMEMTSKIIIHGEGGKGKTQILKYLFTSLMRKKFHPIFVDLKKYTVENSNDLTPNENDIINNIFQHTAPRIDIDSIKYLSDELKIVLLIDGLNEISDDKKVLLLKCLKELSYHKENIYIIITTRMTDIDETSEYWHAFIDPLNIDSVKNIYNSKFGTGEFEKLSENLKQIFTRPFFLSLTVNSGYSFATSHIRSQIFTEFFQKHAILSQFELESIANATINSINSNSIQNFKKFLAELNTPLIDKLKQVSVCSPESISFEHDLWKDFFVAVYLSLNSSVWNHNYFDKATNFGSNLESLMLTIELITDNNTRNNFLKSVFDWSYIAALDCICQINYNTMHSITLDEGICTAIISAITEKKFDSIERTRRNANSLLMKNNYKTVAKINLSHSRDNLSSIVSNTEFGEDWFIKWKRYFTGNSSYVFSHNDLMEIDSIDPIIGWTVSNFLRRVNLNSSSAKILRDLFKDYVKCPEKDTVRWRIVHSLGAYPELENIDLLIESLNSDSYYWVSYGSARALVEIAAKAEDSLRNIVLEKLKNYIPQKHDIPINMQRKIFMEIIESAFIYEPKAGWKNAFKSVILEIMKNESDSTIKSNIEKRLLEFDNYDESLI